MQGSVRFGAFGGKGGEGASRLFSKLVQPPLTTYFLCATRADPTDGLLETSEIFSAA
jgi:hypothetical protein